MAWKKANQELIELLEKTVVKYPCDRRMMFGSPTFFVNNNMFAGVHEDNVILRLNESDRKEISSRYQEVGPFTPMGRPMREYIALPVDFVKAQPKALDEWLEKSFRFAEALPPKEPKRKKKK